MELRLRMCNRISGNVMIEITERYRKYEAANVGQYYCNTKHLTLNKRATSKKKVALSFDILLQLFQLSIMDQLQNIVGETYIVQSAHSWIAKGASVIVIEKIGSTNFKHAF